MTQRLTEYLRQTYGAEAEYPWKDDGQNAVFRHRENRKWFALLMRGLSPGCLGLSREGSMDVLNLKCDPNFSGSVKDGRHVFPAYHMNKEHWISVLLDEGLDFGLLTVLVDMSYELTK